MRLAGASARFDTRFLQLGIHPGGGHTWMLRRAVGPQAAAAMVLCGEVLDAAEAERIGLVWRAVADDELLPTAVAMGAKAAGVPHELLRRTKATLADMATIDDHDTAVARDSWRAPQPHQAHYLRQLSQWGYPLAEVEQIITGDLSPEAAQQAITG